MPEERLRRLAQAIDRLAAKDEELLRRTREIEALRREAAAGLHRICSEFVESVNALVTKVRLELSPPDYSPDAFRDPGANLFQINAKGRVIQIEFEATEALTSTENYRYSYIIQGAVRCFNQELLDRVDIQEQRVFFCVDKRREWRYLDTRGQRSGTFDGDFLAGLFEKLV